ncbi:MAG TPA: hypothetical protein VF789_31120 [Thermoanaerobaculia bacterium]
MRRPLVFLILSLSAAVPLFAGDPVPDVDVTVEQVPGKGFTIEFPAGGAFDEVRVRLPRGIAKDVTPGRLPSGWALSRDGRDLVLKGPEVAPPARLRMTLGSEDRPREVGYEVLRGGASLVRRDGVAPRTAPRYEVRNSLQGIVYLPPDVAPGETITFRAQEDAPLPPGGRFVLSGVVAEPIPEEDLAGTVLAIVNTTRSNIKKTMSAALPPEGLTLRGGTCGDLAPLAAALVAGGNARHTGPVAASREAGDAAATAGWAVASLRSRHDPAMGAIRNLKFFLAAAPLAGGQGEGAGDGLSIKEKGIWRMAAPGGKSTVVVAVGKPDKPPSLSDPQTVPVALRGETIEGGCRFVPRDPSWLELYRAAREAPPPASSNSLSGTVHAVEVPEWLAPGAALSLTFIDRYGEVWLDVPAVEGTAVKPPRPEGGEAAQPCIRTATRYVQGADLVCVCGSFPTPESSLALRIGDRPAGTPVSASFSAVRLQTPRGLPLGNHRIAGSPDAGFSPSCQAEVSHVLIRGEIDSQRLLRGESTPMRLIVQGTADRVPVRVRNLTPGIITIEGGEEQVAESSGGAENVVTRQVRGTGRGSFNVEWSLASPPCPCGEETAER